MNLIKGYGKRDTLVSVDDKVSVGENTKVSEDKLGRCEGLLERYGLKKS